MKVSVLNPEISTNCNVRIGLSGEFDALGCKEIRKDLEQLIIDHTGKYIELDLSEVTFIDSSGIGAIVFMYKRLLENGGNLKLAGVNGQPQELITLLRVDKVISVEWSSQTQTKQAEA